MTQLLSPTTLRELFKSPELIAQELGAGLLPWMLEPARRERLGLEPPTPSIQRGAACVLLASAPGLCEEGSALARGWVLPVLWRRGQEDDTRLPDALIQVAAAVRAALGEESAGWGLGLAPELGLDADLSGLPLEGASAFAPLAAALTLALGSGTPQAHIFSTGIQGNAATELLSVGGLDAKLDAIRALHLSRKATLFVPPGNLAEARTLAGDDLHVASYPVEAHDWRSVLKPHLAALDAPPHAEATLDEHCAYLNRPWQQNARQRRPHYQRHVLPRLADQLRAVSPMQEVDRLLVNLSFQPEVAALAILALQPREVQVLATPDSIRQAPELLRLLGQRAGVDILEDAHPLPPSRLRELERWLAAAPQGKRCVEITSGTGLMAATLATLGARVGARILYLQSNYANTMLLYGTERCLELTHEEPPHRANP